jgi:FkbM family methyltransferase
VSLLGYLYHLKKWTRMVACGCGFRDKLTLCAWLLLDTIPRIVMPPSPQKEPFRLQKDRLMSKVMISVNGCVFRCLDTESVSILSPYSEDWMWDYLNLNPGDVFVDVGAHIGKYTIPAARMVGMGGLVIAVEPHPENYRVLLDNIKLNALRNVIALNLAAWSTSGEVKLYIGDRSGWHSTKRNYGKGFITVQGRALDDLFDELKVKRIDFIKIDVEYAESEVLRGLESTISKYGPDMIVESWYPWEIDRLNKYGYTVAKIAPGYYYLSRNVKIQSHPKSGKRFFAYKYL